MMDNKSLLSLYFVLAFFSSLPSVFAQGISQKVSQTWNLDSSKSVVAPNVYHIVMYGQSLMLGTRSVPILTSSQKYNSLMFKGGIRSGYDKDSAFYQGFLPLKEKIVISPRSGGKLGETPASGFSEAFINLILQEGNTSYDKANNTFKDWNNQLLISSPAQGSTAAKALSDNPVYWQRFQKDIKEAYRLCKELGVSYNVPFILWNQGERDIDIGTTAEAYCNYLKAFQRKANLFIKSVTGQQNTVKLILYQTSSNNVRKAAGNPEIANAQYQLAKNEPDISMSNATYQLPYSSDDVHLSNVGSKWNGANHGIAAKRILIDKMDWRPIYVQKVTFKNNKISLKFHVPVPPLVLDETMVTNPGNYGFRVFNKNNDEIKIDAVRIVKDDQVEIIVNEVITKGSYVWYGNTGTTTGAIAGARGNLRDSQGEAITMDINGKSIRIDNWTPIFKEIVN